MNFETDWRVLHDASSISLIAGRSKTGSAQTGTMGEFAEYARRIVAVNKD
jgi:hypothetical protein